MTEEEKTMTLEEAKAKIAELERKIAEYEESRKLSNMARPIIPISVKAAYPNYRSVIHIESEPKISLLLRSTLFKRIRKPKKTQNGSCPVCDFSIPLVDLSEAQYQKYCSAITEIIETIFKYTEVTGE